MKRLIIFLIGLGCFGLVLSVAFHNSLSDTVIHTVALPLLIVMAILLHAGWRKLWAYISRGLGKEIMK
jgi:hypothetical protein